MFPISPKQWPHHLAAPLCFFQGMGEREGHVEDLARGPCSFQGWYPEPRPRLTTGDSTKYIRIDHAHTFAIDGVGKDFLASCIIMMIRAGHFGNGNVPHSFQNAYASFLAYCNAYKKNTSITEFGYNTCKLPQNWPSQLLQCFLDINPYKTNVDYVG